MDKYENEAYIEECRDIINDTDIEITGIGHDKKSDRALLKLEVSYSDKTVNALSKIMSALLPLIEDSDYYE